MNARSKKKVSKNSELKTTLIILLIFVLCAGTIIFLHKQKQIVKNPKVFKPPIVIVPPTVLQSALPVTVKLNKTPIRKAVPSINVKSFKIAFVIDDWGYSTRNCSLIACSQFRHGSKPGW